MEGSSIPTWGVNDSSSSVAVAGRRSAPLEKSKTSDVPGKHGVSVGANVEVVAECVCRLLIDGRHRSG